ncbi:bifunctional Profilin superfamily/Profilin [Babesia duncani]|uniref:Bifunctional Profilin superfamily/Profilin n=1 Tax=Babesia duncani TaxID=323732 RepID=A0AAD9PIQ0_9APIC|nr:bifunctional Profilin superfamily/Profilin [Babesia duncani]
MSDWVPTIKTLALSNNAAFGAGIANAADGELFAAADIDHEDLCWDSVYKDPYEYTYNDDNGKQQKHQIEEKVTIKEAFDNKSSTLGIFIGGEKYTFASYYGDLEVGAYTFEGISAAKPKGGAHLIKTPGGYIVIVVYDESRGQDKIKSRMAAISLAEYMAQNGY